MKYLEFIHANENFQSSVNLQYDFMDRSKISSYIPTKKSIEILKDYLENVVYDKKDNSTCLIGPYGKGKSHLILVLMALLCENNQEKELTELIKKIKYTDKRCGELAEETLKKEKYFPIIINFNEGNDLSQSVLISLKRSLKNYGADNLLPETYFDSALETINTWENNDNKVMINNFKNLLKNNENKNLELFKSELLKYDEKAYEIFKNIFAEITVGLDFNPLVNCDIVKLIEEIILNLKKEYGYTGVIIVFDEFSKFIESSLEVNNTKDLKILQDLAELVQRCREPKVQFICITHKTINEYINRLPKEKIDGWRTIEGRFSEKFFVASLNQVYELIANTIVKDRKKLDLFLKENINIIEKNSYKWHALFSGFLNKDEFYNNIIKNCFPLHPYVTFALPVISEKIAQNERTLFTYLSGHQENTLTEFINKNAGEFNLVTLDLIYDYFEPALKKEIFNTKIYETAVKADAALKRVKSDLSKKIIKVLAIIYILDQQEIFSPTIEVLESSLLDNEKEINLKVQELINKGILMCRKGNETIDFLPLSSVNVKAKIKDTAEIKFRQVDYGEIFAEIGNEKYIIPKKYNFEKKMIRFFRQIFMTGTQLESYKDGHQLLNRQEADGLVINLIYRNPIELEMAKNWLNNINDKRILLNIPQSILSDDIEKDIRSYEAVKYLLNDKEFLKEDEAVEIQLQIYKEDLLEKISRYLKNYYDYNKKSSCIYGKYKNHKKLNEIVSDICFDVFPNAPVINNEMINKNHLSAPVRKVRDNIIEMILNKKYKEFDYYKNSAEATIFRAVLVNKNLLEDTGELKENNIVLKTIKEFFKTAETEVLSFKILYDKLTGCHNKIGMRKGSIPIYIAYCIKDIQNEIVLYIENGRNRKEIVLDAQQIVNIEDKPEAYSVFVEKGTQEKSSYIKELESIFEGYGNFKTNNIYLNIIKSMKSWFETLPACSQRHKINLVTDKEVPKEYSRFINKFTKYELDYRKFIYEEILTIFKTDSYEKAIKKIKKFKKYYDFYEDDLKNKIIGLTKDIFSENSQESLKNAAKNWFDNLDFNQKTHSFDKKANKFLEVIKKDFQSDNILADKFAYVLTGTHIEDWNENNFKDYFEQLKTLKSAVEEYKSEKSSSFIKISLFEDNGITSEKSFDIKEISPLGELLINNINEAIEEFSEAVDDNEKRNAIINVLEKYL